MQGTLALNRAELRRYLGRIGDRWRLDGAYLGGSAFIRAPVEAPLADRELEYTVVLVSDTFDEIPWLERVYVATSLWDALEMGAPADVHCYTRAEFARKRETMPAVRDAVAQLDLLGVI